MGRRRDSIFPESLAQRSYSCLYAYSAASYPGNILPCSNGASCRPIYNSAAYQGLKAAEYLDFLGQWAPKVLGVFAQGLVMLLLVIFPFVDRNPERNPRKRKFIIFLGIAGMIGFIILTIWGYVS